MKKVLFLFVTMFCSIIMSAQDVLRIHYDFYCRNVEENVYPTKENRVLEINDSCSAFFWINVLNDGIPFGHEIFPFSVYKHYPTKDEVTVLAGVSNFTYYYTEEMPDFDWELLPGDTTICSYSCHKARTNYRGRTWTAWYAEDLPYDDGPWKLRGLPGLILKAVDSRGDFAFTAIGIGKTQTMPVMDWKMMEGDSVICDYPVQKAMTTFRGRTWIVWYAMDLPYGEGPWKLNGLPGVILKAYDTKGDFSFSAFKIGTNMTQALDANPFRTDGYAKTTGVKFEKDLKDYYADKAKFVTGKSIVDDPVNGFFRPAPEQPCLMDDYEAE